LILLVYVLFHISLLNAIIYKIIYNH